MRRAPAFWWAATPTLPAHLLRPASLLYGEIAAHRMARPGLVLPVPVLCVGNFVAGGAGKTPVALALATLLRAAGHRPAFLSRGYGRRAPAAGAPPVVRVDPSSHDAHTVGDEPLLLAAAAPTFVAADRRAAARAAVAEGVTVLVLDDGLQNPALHKTLSVAVVDGAVGLGNGLPIPSGPLRAPLTRQWPFVHAVCIIGDGRPGDGIATLAEARGLPVLRGRLQPDPAVVARLRGTPLLAFAGIGRPQKFFETLDGCGLDVRSRRVFPDHHAYDPAEVAALVAEAAKAGLRLVTTAKDHVRLPSGTPAVALPVTLRFAAPDTVRNLLANRLPAPGT